MKGKENELFKTQILVFDAAYYTETHYVEPGECGEEGKVDHDG